jgi:hypothetical protein
MKAPMSGIRRYVPGAILRVRLHSGRGVEAKFVKTVHTVYGFRLQVEFGEEVAQIDTAQIMGMYEYCLLRRRLG